MDQTQLFSEEKKLYMFALYGGTEVILLNIILSAVAIKIQISFFFLGQTLPFENEMIFSLS